MEIISIVRKDQIPGHSITSESKKKFLKSVAALGVNESLKIKVKDESEATRIALWLKTGFTQTKYRLTRRTVDKQLFAFVYREEV